jgi:hypothetical protein
MNFYTRMILTILITIYFVNRLAKKLLIVQTKSEVEKKSPVQTEKKKKSPVQTEKKNDIVAKKKSPVQTEKKNNVKYEKKNQDQTEKKSISNEVIEKKVKDFKKKVHKIIEKQKYEYPDYSRNINQFFLQKTIR